MTQHLTSEDNLSNAFPDHPRSLHRILVWCILSLADLIIGSSVTILLGPEPIFPGIAIALGIAGGLFWLEAFLWNAVEGLFQ